MKRAIVSLLFLLLLLFDTGASPYPRIAELNLDDPLFRQLNDDVRLSYRSLASGDPPPPLQLYSYRPREEESLFSISARCSLPYESLAGLNSLSSPQLAEDSILLIPNCPGTFHQLPPASDIDYLEAGRPLEEEETVQEIWITGAEGERSQLRFYPKRRFTSLQRAFFLGVLFRLPLPDAVLSSSFGYRPHPFGGKLHFHHGIDLAAPEGSPVYPARPGQVIQTGWDDILGNFIRISHESGYETVYGHLKSVSVQLKSDVRLDMIIGNVGSTGLSTGPHLHFEIRRNGLARNPQGLLPEIQQ